MGEIRERITKRWRGRGADSLYVTKDAALRQEWDAGNLIPAGVTAAAKALAALRKPRNMVRGDSEYYKKLRAMRGKK